MSHTPQSYDPLENWNKLHSLVSVNMSIEDGAAYGQMLDALADNIWDSEKDIMYAGFMHAPAATGNHHAYEGGLVRHLLEMWDIWLLLRDRWLHSPHITDDRVLKAIINHDLHKAYRTYVMNIEGLVTKSHSYGRDETDTLLTSDTKSIWLLMKHNIKLDVEQLHALLWAEGGFSKIKPKETSALAKICYLLDEASGNVQARLDEGTVVHRR